MKYVKSIGVELCAMAAFIIAAIAVVFAWLKFLLQPGVATVVSGWPIAAIASLVFVAGFFGELYRLSGRESPARR